MEPRQVVLARAPEIPLYGQKVAKASKLGTIRPYRFGDGVWTAEHLLSEMKGKRCDSGVTIATACLYLLRPAGVPQVAGRYAVAPGYETQ